MTLVPSATHNRANETDSLKPINEYIFSKFLASNPTTVRSNPT